MVYAFILKTAAIALTLAASANAQISPDPETFTLTHPSGSNATVSLRGCQVKSFYSPQDRIFYLRGGSEFNILFTSNDTNTDRKQPDLSGITMAFPNIGVDEGSLPVDGFARSEMWTLASYVNSTALNIPSVATFTLESSDATRAIWPFDFKLTYEIRLFSEQLKMVLRVQNTFTKPITFQALLTSHLFVENVPDYGVVVQGLIDNEYYDKVAKARKTETREYITINSEIDNVYINAPDSLQAIIRITDDLQRNVVLTKESICRETNGDITVFNPWIERSRVLSYFLDTDYLNMLAIGAGSVIQKQSLDPSASYTLRQSVVHYIKYLMSERPTS